MISGVNYSTINFNGFVQKMAGCDLRTPMERAIAEINLNADAKVKYIKKAYKGSPLSLSSIISHIYEKSAEEIAAVERKYNTKPIEFMKRI